MSFAVFEFDTTECAEMGVTAAKYKNPETKIIVFKVPKYDGVIPKVIMRCHIEIDLIYMNYLNSAIYFFCPLPPHQVGIAHSDNIQYIQYINAGASFNVVDNSVWIVDWHCSGQVILSLLNAAKVRSCTVIFFVGEGRVKLLKALGVEN